MSLAETRAPVASVGGQPVELVLHRIDVPARQHLDLSVLVDEGNCRHVCRWVVAEHLIREARVRELVDLQQILDTTALDEVIEFLLRAVESDTDELDLRVSPLKRCDRRR